MGGLSACFSTFGPPAWKNRGRGGREMTAVDAPLRKAEGLKLTTALGNRPSSASPAAKHARQLRSTAVNDEEDYADEE